MTKTKRPSISTLKSFNDREFLLSDQWETCCVKQRALKGEKTGVMGYAAYGVVTTVRSKPVEVYLRDMGDGGGDFANVKTYESLDAMLADGWIVD